MDGLIDGWIDCLYCLFNLLIQAIVVIFKRVLILVILIIKSLKMQNKDIKFVAPGEESDRALRFLIILL